MFCSQLVFSILAPFWSPFWENFGSLLDSFGLLGAPWGLQVELQGVLEGVLDTPQFQTLEYLGKSDFWVPPGGVGFGGGG